MVGSEEKVLDYISLLDVGMHVVAVVSQVNYKTI